MAITMMTMNFFPESGDDDDDDEGGCVGDDDGDDDNDDNDEMQLMAVMTMMTMMMMMTGNDDTCGDDELTNVAVLALVLKVDEIGRGDEPIMLMVSMVATVSITLTIIKLFSSTLHSY